MAVTNHPEYKAHLAGILKTPDDDLRRLVLADWLEEHGENERAEFIRVQCRLAELGECRGYKSKPWPHPGGRCCLSGCEFCWLTDRERELWGTPGFADKSSSLTTCVLPDHKKTQFRLWTEYGPLLTVRRGFVAEVRCTLADWCGGECRHCGGSGYRQWYTGHGNHETSDCLDCSGTGHTPGIGPRLVREHPVEVVRITDAEPNYVTTWAGRESWNWYTGTAHGPANIPLGVFLVMGVIEYVPLEFPTRSAALAALFVALIAWAKGDVK